MSADRIGFEEWRASRSSALRCPTDWESWQAALAWERERWADVISDGLQSDFENGVKWLNERAADEFGTKYPALAAILRGTTK